MNPVVWARIAMSVAAFGAVLAAVFMLNLPASAENSPTLHGPGYCGPDGKLTEEGTCIDQEPVFVELCPGARKAVPYYRRLTWDRQAARVGDLADRTPIVKGKTCHWSRYAAGEWQARARASLKALKRWNREYAWWLWLPVNWRALSTCETHLDFEHANSTHLSAFGITIAEYDADAAYMGAPPWHVRHTPRDQYLAARGHLARFGDGWTCPGP